MSNCGGKFQTINQGYKGSADSEITIRENWMNGPTRANFTGCGSAGWNAGKAPCTACDSDSQYGSRICNACRTNANISSDCGGNACAWQPATNYIAQSNPTSTKQSAFYF